MLHPVSRQHQTLRRTVLIRDDGGVDTRRKRITLTDLFERIDAHLAEM